MTAADAGLNNPATRVERIATIVRTIIEQVSVTMYHPLGRFPHGWCDDTSRVLAILLREQGEVGFERVCGTRRGSETATHVWLQRGELVVDITADQFDDEVSAPVIVSADARWHRVWDRRVSHALEEIDPGRIEGELYDAIKATDAWRRFAGAAG